MENISERSPLSKIGRAAQAELGLRALEVFFCEISRYSRGHWGSTCPRQNVSVTLETMELHFTPEQEAQPAQIATQEGTDAERLVREAALRLLEEDARFPPPFVRVLRRPTGAFIEQEEMNARVEQMLRS